MSTPRTKRKRRASPRPLEERFPWLRYDRVARAVTERLRVRPVSGQPFWVFAVRNPVHHTQYQVSLPDLPGGEAQFCSCVDFSRRGIGTCKHIEAASAWLDAHPEAPRPLLRRSDATRLWSAIDAARKEADAADRPASLRLRAPGRRLFEPGGTAPSMAARKRTAGRGSAEPAGPARP
jgi:hypothetical protein